MYKGNIENFITNGAVLMDVSWCLFSDEIFNSWLFLILTIVTLNIKRYFRTIISYRTRKNHVELRSNYTRL